MGVATLSGESLLDVGGRIDRLRGDFDRSFTEPARSHDVEHVELLAVGAGGRPYALRLSQTAGLHPDRPVTPLPGPLPALLGLAGFAGTVVPVYDLAALLGHPGAGRPRWLVLAAGTPMLALAFHELHGHVRVAADAIVTEATADGGGCLRGMVTLRGGTQPIVDVPAARALVHSLTGHDPATSEEIAR
ncbi:chemotaxis protein CheW [Actinoplanes sp. NPDC051411]|uniref:chemotaxis protein CheW n=1 Tax=Actinoplanes sp. NPDC051411 TaxID=3155522 RepID=UPI00343BDF78